MNETLAFSLPVFMLTLVVAGYMLTVFEPYFALNTAEGKELLDYHRKDPKLRFIAEWWARALVDPTSRWFDADNPAVYSVYERVFEALVRHRFLCGDDPSKLRYGSSLSPILARAIRNSGVALPAGLPAVQMNISQREVRIDGGSIVWRGRPADYKSRFCDFYPEP